ncbi:MAG: cobalamin-dependent protein [Acidobacteriota bacterium]
MANVAGDRRDRPLTVVLIKPKARLGTILGLQRFQCLEPLELGYLAAVIAPPHRVHVLDLRRHRFADAALNHALHRLEPNVVGISGYTHEASEVKRLAAWVRRARPAARVVVGGHHATVAPRDFDAPSIDAIVRGEGCAPFREIVARLSSGEDLGGIPNVLLSGAGFDDNAAAGWPEYPDPASLPRPRRDLWDSRWYTSAWLAEHPRDWATIFPPVASVRTSFGCTMKCSFCIVPHLSGGRHSTRPVQDVVEEIAGLSASHVYFCDDENFIDETFALELAEALAERGVAKRYFAWTRSTTVNRSPDLLRRWREIGLDAAFLGFEFPTDEELRAAHKGGSVAANERAHATLRALGVAVHAAFMVRPEYGAEEFDRLRKYVREMPPAQCSFTVCTPSPGTCDYRAMLPRVWVDRPYDLHDCMHPLTPTALPLREYARRFATQAAEGVAKTPLREARRPIPPGDIARAAWAARRYESAFATLYRDYPRELWSSTP